MSLLAAHGLFSPGGLAERVVRDGKRVLLAAVHADRPLPVLHQLQPGALLAAAALRARALLPGLDDGLRLLLPSLPQRAHPQLPAVRRPGGSGALDRCSVDSASVFVAVFMHVTPECSHSGMPTR